MQYKRDVEFARQELNTMKHTVMKINKETENVTIPSINNLLKDLKLAITAQKDENSKLQSQITDLKKEKSQVQQLIIGAVKKIAQLEEQVGSYT